MAELIGALVEAIAAMITAIAEAIPANLEALIEDDPCYSSEQPNLSPFPVQGLGQT